MRALTQRYLRFFSVALLLATLSLSGCQTAPRKGLTPAQIAVLKEQGFELTEEGWAFGLSGKVLFGSDLEVLNAQSQEIVERIGTALLGLSVGDTARWLEAAPLSGLLRVNGFLAAKSRNSRLLVLHVNTLEFLEGNQNGSFLQEEG